MIGVWTTRAGVLLQLLRRNEEAAVPSSPAAEPNVCEQIFPCENETFGRSEIFSKISLQILPLLLSKVSSGPVEHSPFLSDPFTMRCLGLNLWSSAYRAKVLPLSHSTSPNLSLDKALNHWTVCHSTQCRSIFRRRKKILLPIWHPGWYTACGNSYFAASWARLLAPRVNYNAK